MLFAARGTVPGRAGGLSDGVLHPTLALMSSFGPVVALANLGSTLQNTFAAGNRVLDILEEDAGGGGNRRTGQTICALPGQRRNNVTFSYGGESHPGTTSPWTIPEGQRGGHRGPQRQRQIHTAEAVYAVLGRTEGRGARSPAGTIHADQHRKPAGHGELCHAGDPPVPRQHREQPAHRQAGRHPTRRSRQACKKASVHDFIDDACPRATTPRWASWADTLSGGERQRHGPGAGLPPRRAASCCWTSPPAIWTA